MQEQTIHLDKHGSHRVIEKPVNGKTSFQFNSRVNYAMSLIRKGQKLHAWRMHGSVVYLEACIRMAHDELRHFRQVSDI